MRTAKVKVNFVKLLIGLFFIVTVILPFSRLLLNFDPGAWRAFFASRQSLAAIKNSLVLSCVATVISLALSFLLALCITRSKIRCKPLFTTILTIPMLIPSISHGMGLIVLLGANGVLTNLFHLNWNIYGFWGVVAGSVLYSFPVAFLMFMDSFKYENASPYEAATVLGIPKRRQFTAIMIPYIRRPLISIAFATFTLIVTDYGVPLIIGGQYTTLPVLMYQEVIGLLDFQKGSVMGIILLVPAVIAFILDLVNKDHANDSFSPKPFDLKRNRGRDLASYLACIAASVLVLAPILAFVLLTFSKKYPMDMTFTMNHITQTLQMQGGLFLKNSVIISLSVAVIGVIAAFVTAYLTARIKSGSSRLLHLISITSLAIPGIVLGLSYTLTFQKSWIYGTLGILVLVNLIHFFASPYLLMYNALGKINTNIEDVGRTLGVGRLHLIFDVFLPQTKGTLLEMFSYFFVNSMMTISAVSFLANMENKPISLMITQFEAQSQIECAALVSLAILLVNLLMKAVIHLLKRSKGDLKNAYQKAV